MFPTLRHFILKPNATTLNPTLHLRPDTLADELNVPNVKCFVYSRKVNSLRNLPELAIGDALVDGIRGVKNFNSPLRRSLFSRFGSGTRIIFEGHPFG